jgi:hypothetical protein
MQNDSANVYTSACPKLSQRCRVELRKGRFCIFLSALLACRGMLLPQQSSADALSGQHLPVGVWQSKQPDGSVIGIDLSALPASMPDYPEGTPSPLGSRLLIGVFQKQHKRILCGEENFFVAGWADFAVSYANGKLEIHYDDRVSSSEIHVELVFDPIKDAWTGHFHRERYDGRVILHRTSDQPDPAQGGCRVGSNSWRNDRSAQTDSLITHGWQWTREHQAWKGQ